MGGLGSQQTKMPNFCSECGAKLTPSDRACAQCGASAGPVPSAPSFNAGIAGHLRAGGRGAQVPAAGPCLRHAHVKLACHRTSRACGVGRGAHGHRLQRPNLCSPNSGGTASHLQGLWCQVRATTHRQSILGPVVPVLKISCAHCIGMICDENCLRACVHFSVRIDFFCMHGRECFSYARTYLCVRALCASMCHDASRCQDCTGTTALVKDTALSCSVLMREGAVT